LNPHAAQPASPVAIPRSLWRHRELLTQLVRREVVGRYQGSVMGIAWSLLNPLLMLGVYTFVFSVVFQARWHGGGDESKTRFAVVLFAGMIVHSLFAEVLVRAPGLILANVNYVRKVVFPLEILPVVSMGAALFHTLVSLLVLLAALLAFNHVLPWTALALPLVLLPLVVLAMGLAWILASLGVFIRDIGQTIGILMTMLLFLSPVFFPLAALPEVFRPLIMANPLTFIIEQTRQVLIWGQWPDWRGLGLYALVAGVVACSGFAWFQKTRKGFADVI